MSSRRWLHPIALALLLDAGSAAAADRPRIASVQPLADRPYLVVDVADPKSWADTAFTFEADGRVAPSQRLGGGFDPNSSSASYLVFPGATCRRLSARWGDGPSQRTGATRVSWKAPALAVLLDRLGDREALFVPGALEFQVFPPATVRFLQDGAELEPTAVDAAGPGRRLRVTPRWRAGLNTVRMVVAGPAGPAERTFTFVLLDDGGLAPGEAARLVYGEVGSRSGPFFELAVEGDAVALERKGFAAVLVADGDGWLREDQVLVADLRARAEGEAILRILEKAHFTEPSEPRAEHRILVAAAVRPSSSGLARDPVEDDPRYAEVFANVDAEVAALLADDPRRGGEGFCHVVWGTKKGLLKEKYGIDWRTPAELNPQVIFD